MRILNGIMDCCSVLIVLTISTWAVINISWLVQYFTNLNIFEYPSSLTKEILDISLIFSSTLMLCMKIKDRFFIDKLSVKEAKKWRIISNYKKIPAALLVRQDFFYFQLSKISFFLHIHFRAIERLITGIS